MKTCTVVLVVVAVCCQCCPSLAGSWKESMLQNDLLAASSWALFDIDPYSFLTREETGRSGTNETFDYSDIVDAMYEEDVLVQVGPEDLPKSSISGKEDRQLGKKRQLITFQDDRPVLKVDLRLLKMKLIELYDQSYLTLFLGTTAKGYLEDIFSIKSRGNEDNFMTALEDLVSMLGVDGPACVHRLLCDLGSAPAFKTHGLFGELADLSIRYVLTEEYARLDPGVSNSIDDQDGGGGSSSGAEGEARGTSDKGSMPSTPISYLDAVAAGRHGAECAYKFSECPISLLSMLKLINDNN